MGVFTEWVHAAVRRCDGLQRYVRARNKQHTYDRDVKVSALHQCARGTRGCRVFGADPHAFD